MGREHNEVAKRLLTTLPALMQPVAYSMRHCENPMPMPHLRTLMILEHGTRTMTDLAEMQHVSAPTMSNTVSVLVEHGWVGRVADEHDRRRVDLRLTDEGRAAAREVKEHVETLLSDRLSVLQPAEVDTLMAGLDVLALAFGTHTTASEGGEAE